jgi:hypothetical protein
MLGGVKSERRAASDQITRVGYVGIRNKKAKAA